jgi:hypothetical protein
MVYYFILILILTHTHIYHDDVVCTETLEPSILL